MSALYQLFVDNILDWLAKADLEVTVELCPDKAGVIGSVYDLKHSTDLSCAIVDALWIWIFYKDATRLAQFLRFLASERDSHGKWAYSFVHDGFMFSLRKR